MKAAVRIHSVDSLDSTSRSPSPTYCSRHVPGDFDRRTAQDAQPSIVLFILNLCFDHEPIAPFSRYISQLPYALQPCSFNVQSCFQDPLILDCPSLFSVFSGVFEVFFLSCIKC